MPYRKLAFKSFNVFDDSLAILKAHSDHQTANSFQIQSILQGQSPNITTVRPVQYFDLHSLWLGCVVASQTGLLVSPCTLEFTPYKVKGAGPTPAKKRCAFTGGAALQLCSFPSTFSRLEAVAVGFADVATLNITTVLELDDVKGITYQ